VVKIRAIFVFGSGRNLARQENMLKTKEILKITSIMKNLGKEDVFSYPRIYIQKVLTELSKI
jgi:hypothetical protein